ncbi:MAG: UDP-2,3-diacylglucosamine diphosphatase [Muribaculaceae bacterium]|nr:UDP-2,3-diacylglucosamine diphosphatase [Muribaculaceae bacterium]
MHLGSRYLTNGRDNEKMLCAWLDSIKHDAKDLYMLGDVLDYWYEYKYVVPKGHIRFFGKLAELADSGVKIHWFIGNHDIWLFDYFQKEIDIEIIDGEKVVEIDGKRFFLAHGDGVGKQSLGFRFIRSIFRNKVCQFFYSAIHPRWTIPFAFSWSSHSRKTGESSDRYAQDTAQALEAYRVFANEYNQEHTERPIDYFIFGHLHTLVNEKLNSGASLIVLGDWIKLFSYAKFSNGEMVVNTVK